MGQITATRNVVATKVVRHAGQLRPSDTYAQRQSIIGSDDGLSPGRHQAITCTSVGNCQLYYQEETSVKFKSKVI